MDQLIEEAVVPVPAARHQSCPLVLIQRPVDRLSLDRLDCNLIQDPLDPAFRSKPFAVTNAAVQLLIVVFLSLAYRPPDDERKWLMMMLLSLSCIFSSFSSVCLKIRLEKGNDEEDQVAQVLIGWRLDVLQLDMKKKHTAATTGKSGVWMRVANQEQQQ